MKLPTTPARLTAQQTKIPDQIANALRDEIVSKKMVAHDKLPGERELIEMFGASRGSVREALKSLEVQGLIYTVPGPGGGARVREVEEARVFEFMRNFFHFRPVDGAQIYVVRKLVEPATAVSTLGLLTPEHFARLQASIDALDGDDVRNWALHRSAEIDFHDILAEVCPNPLLAMIAKFVNAVIRSGAEASQPSAHHAQEEHEFTCTNRKQHSEILQALRDEDAAQVQALMLAHIEDAEKFIVPLDARIKGRPARPRS